MSITTGARQSRAPAAFQQNDKLAFETQNAFQTVGALIKRPRREMLRIRLTVRQIRNLLPPGDY